jgi:hypothetical protein|tara:strand:- start:1658 stop:2038 length:381 start_codon:yes stop_codon:yes gene_type:complete
MDTFKASVQYGDLKGTSAADRADKNDARSWLVNKGLIKDEEFVVGIRMWAGESHGVHKDPVSVHFLVIELDGHENIPAKIQAEGEPIKVRDVQVDMSITEFLGLFKRFEITLSNSGLIEGKQYSAV